MAAPQRLKPIPNWWRRAPTEVGPFPIVGIPVCGFFVGDQSARSKGAQQPGHQHRFPLVENRDEWGSHFRRSARVANSQVKRFSRLRKNGRNTSHLAALEMTFEGGAEAS